MSTAKIIDLRAKATAGLITSADIELVAEDPGIARILASVKSTPLNFARELVAVSDAVPAKPAPVVVPEPAAPKPVEPEPVKPAEAKPAPEPVAPKPVELKLPATKVKPPKAKPPKRK